VSSETSCFAIFCGTTETNLFVSDSIETVVPVVPILTEFRRTPYSSFDLPYSSSRWIIPLKPLEIRTCIKSLY
jgi:hypothetical protein